MARPNLTQIDTPQWRKLHRASVIVWMLSVVHALGAGSDGAKPWRHAVTLVPMAPVVYLLVMWTLGAERGGTPRAERRMRPAPPHRHDRLDQLDVASQTTRS